VTVEVVCADARGADELDDPPIDVERWRRLAIQALVEEGVDGELTLTFVDRDEIAELNAEHMGRAGPTDVLSFPLDADPRVEPADGPARGAASLEAVPRLLGDVVISPAVAAEQCPEHAGTLDDELALLVVHGILHVLGHDHAEPAAASRMRDRERSLLRAHHWHGDPPAAFRHDHA
jgi:probable rRNA maturation factor